MATNGREPPSSQSCRAADTLIVAKPKIRMLKRSKDKPSRRRLRNGPRTVELRSVSIPPQLEKNGSDNACQKRARCSAVRRGHSQKFFVRSQVCNIAGMRGAGGAIVESRHFAESCPDRVRAILETSVANMEPPRAIAIKSKTSVPTSLLRSTKT